MKTLNHTKYINANELFQENMYFHYHMLFFYSSTVLGAIFSNQMQESPQ